MNTGGAPFLRACLGACGSGKSFELNAMVDHDLSAGRGPFLVMDISAADWPGQAKKHRHARVKTVEAAKLALQAGERFVIVSPVGDDEAIAAATGHALCDLAAELGGVTLVLPEAHTVAPQSGTDLPPAVERLAHRWRHRRVRLWLDTQYSQYVSKRLLRACQCWYWFTTGGGAAVDAARELYAPLEIDIATVSRLATRQKGRGHAVGVITEPGWHAEIPVFTPELRVVVSPDGRRYSPVDAYNLVPLPGLVYDGRRLEKVRPR